MEKYLIVGANNIEGYIEIMCRLRIPPNSLKVGITEDLIYKVNEEAIKRNISILAIPLSLICKIREKIEIDTGEVDFDNIDHDNIDHIITGKAKFIFLTLLDKKRDGVGVLLPSEEPIEKIENDRDAITDSDITDLRIALNTMDVDTFIKSL